MRNYRGNLFGLSLCQGKRPTTAYLSICPAVTVLPFKAPRVLTSPLAQYVIHASRLRISHICGVSESLMNVGFPSMYGIQFGYFLWSICLMWSWLLDQPKEHWKVEASFLLPQSYFQFFKVKTVISNVAVDIHVYTFSATCMIIFKEYLKLLD